MFGIHPAILICIGICVVILLWTLLGEKFTDIIARMLVGGIIICCVNNFLPQYSIGLNALTMGCSGLLGIPGVAMLYVVGAII